MIMIIAVIIKYVLCYVNRRPLDLVKTSMKKSAEINHCKHV